MGSYNEGKAEVCRWIREHFPPDSILLDVGPSDGKWRGLLPEYVMDAVEVFEPYTKSLKGYREIFIADIKDFEYPWYDLVIMGDVLEHLTVEDAQKVLKWADTHCRDIVISVPFEYVQGAVNGNIHEIHIQDDLTAELFAERYPGYDVLCRPLSDYCYYHKHQPPERKTP